MFVCYRRHDNPLQKFVNEFENFFIQRLSPYVEKRLVRPMQLWWDARVSPGDYWDEEIGRAINNAFSGLLLLSDTLLNSEYIVEREFPMLWKRHSDPTDVFQLHWINLRPTTLSDIDIRLPGLSTIQAINDLSEGPLSHSWHPRDRSHPEFEERFCKNVWERLSKKLNRQLLEAAGQLSPAPPPGVPRLASRTEPRMSRLDTGPEERTGSLAPGLPQLNPSWSVLGDRLVDIKSQLLGSNLATTGLVSPGATFGVHGEGGVGKTVLATQLVQEAEIAATFRDGVFWVTLGRSVQCGPIYNDLLERIREHLTELPLNPADDSATAHREHALTILERQRLSTTQIQHVLHDLLEAINVLIVIDDVWEIGNVRDIVPSSGKSRVLITSRFPGIARGLGGIVIRVDRLTDVEARDFLLEDTSDAGDASVSSDASVAEIVSISNGLLIQLALYRGMARSGVPWSQIVERIRRHTLVVGDGELAEEYRAQAVSIGEIQECGPSFELRGQRWGLADLLLTLAVFPEDAYVPSRVLQDFWRGSDEEVSTVLDELAARRWISYSEESDSVSLHDVTRDYLRLRGPEIRSLNRDLLDRYRPAKIPPQWAKAVEGDEYLRTRLSYHLISGELHGEWVRTVLDPHWIATRIVHDDVSAATGDVEVARQYLDWVSPSEGQALDHLAQVIPRYAQLLHIAAADDDTADKAFSVEAVANTLATKWRQASSVSQITLVSRFDAAANPKNAGHVSGVRCLKYSHLGDRLASGSFDECVCIWDVESETMTRRLVGHTASICEVAWSPDDQYVLTASYDGSAAVWDPESGEQVALLEGHAGPVRTIEWRPGANQLATGSSDGTVLIWEADRWEVVRTIQVSSSPVWNVAWSSQGDRLAAAGADGTIRVFEPHSGSCIVTIFGTEDPIWSLAWSPTAEVLAAGGHNAVIQLWDALGGEHVGSLAGHLDQVNTVAWDASGRYLASGSSDGTARVWDALALTLLDTLTDHETRVPGLDWAPNGRSLATAGYDGAIRIWERSAERHVQQLEGATKWIWSIDVRRRGDLLATSSYDGKIRVISLSANGGAHEIGAHHGPIWSIRWSPDGTMLASAGQDGAIRLWKAAGSEPLAQMPDEDGPVWTAEWSPDGRQIASSGPSGIVRVLEVKSRRELCAMEAGSPVWSLAWSPDGRSLATGGYDGTTRIWRVGESDPRAELSHPGIRVWSAGWTPDSVGVATGPPDENSATSVQSDARASRVLGVCWSPDGRTLASARDDGHVILWDVESQMIRATLKGHRSWVWSIKWIPRRNLVITSGEEGTVRIWDASSGRLVNLLVFGTAVNEVAAAAPTSASRVLAVAHGVAWTVLRFDVTGLATATE